MSVAWSVVVVWCGVVGDAERAHGAGACVDSCFVVGAGGLRCWARGIAGNWIGEEGAAALAQALKENSTLSSLDLVRARVCSRGDP